MSTRRSDFIVECRIRGQSSSQPPVCEESANAMATGNSASALQVRTRTLNGKLRGDILTLVAGNDTGLSP
jgi:hypothetical protein